MKLLMMCTVVVLYVACDDKSRVVGGVTGPSGQTGAGTYGGGGTSDQVGTQNIGGNKSQGTVMPGVVGNQSTGQTATSNVAGNGPTSKNGMASVKISVAPQGQSGISRPAATNKPSPTIKLYNGTCYFRIFGIANVNEFQIVLAFSQPIDSLSIDNFSVLATRHYKVFILSNTVPITTRALEVQYMAGYYPHKQPITGRCSMFHGTRRPIKHTGTAP